MTKTTISFITQKTGTEQGIKIIADEDRNIDSLGSRKTAFLYGETAYFRVYAEDPDKITLAATDGTLTPLGIFSETVSDEIVTFITIDTFETEKTITAVNSFEWLGKNLGNVEKNDLFSVRSTLKPDPETGKIASAAVSYSSFYKLWGISLSKKLRETYPVTVYAGVSNA